MTTYACEVEGCVQRAVATLHYQDEDGDSYSTHLCIDHLEERARELDYEHQEA